MKPVARIDAVLRQGVEAGDMPGVVALAATHAGPLYAGAVGLAPDTVFRIASMTKIVTCVAAMQLVERGKLALEGPVPAIDPALASPQVLEGFDADGTPRLRPARRPITLRHLLTHTAGFCYETWDASMARFVPEMGMPSTTTGQVAALRMPLVFDPGEKWEYGINIDWVGRIVESVSGQRLDAYFREHLFAPLGMDDTGFVASAAQRARQAFVHQRQADGSFARQPLDPPPTPEFWAGGGGLLSTGRDYLTFLEMLLHGGRGNDAQILRAETVALMNRNHVGDMPCGVLRTQNPARSCDADFFPGAQVRWGLGGMLNMEPGPNGRSAGTVSWGGLFNCYFWIDPVRRVTGVIMTQLLPFADPRAVALYGRFERTVYEALGAA
jgi:CubicO group peptidase (beta-lactamase class C family)